MTRWSRPEIQNAVRELTRHGNESVPAQEKAMHRAMEHCMCTPNRGWLLKPKRTWDGKDKEFLFRINGISDSDFAKCPVTRRSVSGYSTFLEGAPITVKSVIQKIVALSVKEAETIAGWIAVRTGHALHQTTIGINGTEGRTSNDIEN